MTTYTKRPTGSTLNFLSFAPILLFSKKLSAITLSLSFQKMSALFASSLSNECIYFITLFNLFSNGNHGNSKKTPFNAEFNTIIIAEAMKASQKLVCNLHICLYLGQFLTNFQILFSSGIGYPLS